MITKFIQGSKTDATTLAVNVSEVVGASSNVCSMVFEITLEQEQATANTARSILHFDAGIQPLRVISAMLESAAGAQKALTNATFAIANDQLTFNGVANAANDKLIVTILAQG